MWSCCRAKHAARVAAAHLGRNLCGGIPRELEAIRVPGSRGRIAAEDGTVADEADLTGAEAAAVAVETADAADSTGAAEAVALRIADITAADTHRNGAHN